MVVTRADHVQCIHPACQLPAVQYTLFGRSY